MAFKLFSEARPIFVFVIDPTTDDETTYLASSGYLMEAPGAADPPAYAWEENDDCNPLHILEMPDLTLYFLQASRSIRIAWLLEELGLDYKLESYDREDTGLAPAGFKESCGTLLGKAPVLKDGKLTLQESGAITEYLCEHYDKSHRLLPTDEAQRIKVREWIHAAEGAFMVHCLPIVYVRRIDATAAEKIAPGLAGNVAKDLDWLETELNGGNGRYLVGDHVTAADTMVAFSVQFIFWLKLAPKNRRWEGVEAWLRQVEAGETYQRAVAKTGHRL